MITFFTGAWAWLRANPVVSKILMWCAIGFALFVGAKTYKAKVENAARKKAKDEYRVESAKAETRVVETIRTIEKETRHEADEAVAVRDAVLEQPVADVVRDAPDHIFKD